MSDECKRCGVTWHPRRLYAECPNCKKDAEIEKLRWELAEARGYAVRLLAAVSPDTEPLDTLPGLLTQIDSVITWLRGQVPSTDPYNMSPDRLLRLGLIYRDGTWYRPKGWGKSDDWEIEPVVRIPGDHADKILNHHRLARIAAAAEAAGQSYVPSVREAAAVIGRLADLIAREDGTVVRAGESIEVEDADAEKGER